MPDYSNPHRIIDKEINRKARLQAEKEEAEKNLSLEERVQPGRVVKFRPDRRSEEEMEVVALSRVGFFCREPGEPRSPTRYYRFSEVKIDAVQ